ncbi:GH32 C-terminal domain-containing protein [Latilactobacillus curvatus]|nr:GH32 C-terminal domain-containing protein [Latilactobacillus curvatus]MCP8848143.1 GH32 C-terminal domain-containing protein [Latilactobacillus curvatus]MCP8865572.1 GH32 C-terminal domain-containing protein [Latilactobacillus curvatus]MCP8874448.1 GH32 C-terminal domain-containing protein [Latilactobacillus curvatus]MCP8876230.1 GH32 C-terminal domain-containing protein [Latilactobacillus curvatus]MCP8879837.1 GH32 C-terminal domain-containing protein [Latilactobacillus curvatus]
MIIKRANKNLSKCCLEKVSGPVIFERRQWATSKIERRQITGNIDDVLLIVDRDIVEVYTMDGLQVMTGRVF